MAHISSDPTTNPAPSAPQLSADDIHAVAVLARLALTEPEAQTMTGQINDLLSQFARLQELDTETVPPTSHAVPVEAPLRSDEIGPVLPRKTALALGPQVDEYLGGFIVPQVLGE